MRVSLSVIYLCILVTITSRVLACSPTIETTTFAQKIAAADIVFIGRVLDAGEDFVEFEIGTAGKNSATKGEKMRLKHGEYGTCGKNNFQKDTVWLYAGDSPFSPTRILRQDQVNADISVLVAAFNDFDRIWIYAPDNPFTICTNDNDCTFVRGACEGEQDSLNKTKAKEAEAAFSAIAKIRDRAACANPESYEKMPPQKAVCSNNRCDAVAK